MRYVASEGLIRYGAITPCYARWCSHRCSCYAVDVATPPVAFMSRECRDARARLRCCRCSSLLPFTPLLAFSRCLRCRLLIIAERRRCQRCFTHRRVHVAVAEESASIDCRRRWRYARDGMPAARCVFADIYAADATRCQRCCEDGLRVTYV